MHTIHAADLVSTEGKEEFKIKWSKGQPTAVPTGMMGSARPSLLTKEQKLALAAEAPVALAGDLSIKEEAVPEKKTKKVAAPKTPKIAKSAPKAKSGKSKLPKFVAEWEAIREQIRAGTSLKDIAAAFGVRYYDVYRVKVHGMDL